MYARNTVMGIVRNAAGAQVLNLPVDLGLTVPSGSSVDQGEKRFHYNCTPLYAIPAMLRGPMLYTIKAMGVPCE